MRFRQLGQDRILRFGKPPRNGGRQFQEPFAVARQAITGRNFLLLAGRKTSAVDFADLMTEQIDFLFARGFRGAEAGVFRAQRLEPAIRFGKFPQRLRVMSVAVEKRELPLRLEQRLMIVRSVQIDEFVAEALENPERGR